jgi:N-hydroxyarylamine O-acetyltransferase
VDVAPPATRLSAEQVDAYLARIAHPAAREPDAETLASLQDAHVRSVPFENLDIHLGVPLTLDVDGLFEKVVERRRGGFCFELNGLFHALLRSLGYHAWLVEARQLEEDGSLGPRYDHARILTVVDGETLLVDVGNGASPRGPIGLRDDEQTVGHQRYRVREHGDRLISDRFTNGAWEPGWTFDTQARDLEDFAERCDYHQHAPESHFTQKPLCSMVTEDGHVTLSDRTFIVTKDDERSESVVDDPLAVLRDRFAITIPRWPGS